VTFTDLPYALPNLRSVVAANTHLVKAGAQPTVGELDWTSPASSSLPSLHEMDLILGSDVVWVEELIPPLVSTLAWLTSAPSSPSIILAHQTRSTRGDELLFKSLEEVGLKVKTVDRNMHHPEFNHPKVNLLTISRAAASKGQGEL
jgi:hypothetical protein